MKILRIIFKALVYVFAIIGFVLVGGYFAIKYHFTDTKGIIDLQNEFFKSSVSSAGEDITKIKIDTNWMDAEEWPVLKAAVTKDAKLVQEISDLTGVDERLIISQLIVEQLRLYTSQRQFFKQFFAPLKILGTQSQFSWGIVGLKEETAIKIENNLKDTESPFYLGPVYENMLDFKTDDPKQERFERLTDQHNHYYDYLYTALYLKQIEMQWKRAGYDISDRPEILSTLYNIGFAKSNPNPSPNVGGAEIEINGKVYSFGSLAYYFYHSDELIDIFPRAR
jgi:hypothetical protein